MLGNGGQVQIPKKNTEGIRWLLQNIPVFHSALNPVTYYQYTFFLFPFLYVIHTYL